VIEQQAKKNIKNKQTNNYTIHIVSEKHSQEIESIDNEDDELQCVIKEVKAKETRDVLEEITNKSLKETIISWG